MPARTNYRTNSHQFTGANTRETRPNDHTVRCWRYTCRCTRNIIYRAGQMAWMPPLKYAYDDVQKHVCVCALCITCRNIRVTLCRYVAVENETTNVNFLLLEDELLFFNIVTGRVNTFTISNVMFSRTIV